jgi:hypothetical protein
VNDEQNIPFLYVLEFENQEVEGKVTEGVMLVSADRRTMPVLAYNTDGKFSTEDEGAKIWIEHFKTELKHIRAKYTEPNKITEGLWKEFEAKNVRLNGGGKEGPNTCDPDSYYSGPVLISTQWRQGAGYNFYSPARSCGPDGKAYTGCGPLAIAQLYNYHQKPANSSGMAGITPFVTFNYPLSGGSSNLEIANLIRIAGHNCSATYTTLPNCNTFNWRENIKTAFQNAGYTNSGTREQFQYGAITTVVNNLKAGYPVIMDGTTQFLGFEDWHFWILDGVVENIYWDYIPENDYCVGYHYRYFHNNWGVSTYSDGWYALGNFNGDGEVYDTHLNVTRSIIP